jgi:dipeptide/tripeptide permease
MNTEQSNPSVTPEPKKGFFTKFPGQFWLVVMFEFFERGAYYGMMSFISVYFTDTLNIPKESVGLIKGVIQPLLYFLPIIAGAIADRFGYRRMLMIAFTLLGGGYFLTSQMTTYTAVFGALVLMGIGAGTFKPLISGTIAKITDESNSTQAFGIYYWSINLGAFLFPLFLVPFLKSINPAYVIIASAICTAAMIIPTAFFFKDPVKQKKVDDKTEKRKQTSLLQTLANAFEIIYSPIVLMFSLMKKYSAWKAIFSLLLVALLLFSGYKFIDQQPASEKFPTIGIQKADKTLLFNVNRNMSKKVPFKIEEKDEPVINLTVYKPSYLDKFAPQLLEETAKFPALQSVTRSEIEEYIKLSDKKVELIFGIGPAVTGNFTLEKVSETAFLVMLKDPDNYEVYKKELKDGMMAYPMMRGISDGDIAKMVKASKGRSFFLLFVITLMLVGLLIVAVSMNNRKSQDNTPGLQGGNAIGRHAAMFLVPAVIIALWFLPGLGTLAQIICSVIYFSIMSLFIIDKTDTQKFVDHAKFLLMIILYSGFWIMYFQMFDSVLWYVQAYVDAASMNNAINAFFELFGIELNWFFDVEHVTVINAGTIILLQLVVSKIVDKRKAMPTMITGIAIATIGMGILAISTDIWIFLLGIFLFSIGEMTAHPKFISYVGLSAPSDKKAMYMGYIFLYGVFGSSVGGIVGAKLYVHFVDNLNQPRTLWIVFSMIGIATIVLLLLYNKFLAAKKEETA